MREKLIEQYLVRECKRIGGIAEKFVSPGKRGVPDRLCQFDGGLVIFVELKATGGKPEPHQEVDHLVRKRRGHEVWVIDSKAGVDEFIEAVVNRAVSNRTKLAILQNNVGLIRKTLEDSEYTQHEKLKLIGLCANALSVDLEFLRLSAPT